MSSIGFTYKMDGSVIAFVNGRPYTVDKTSINYKSVINAIESEDMEKLSELLDIRKAIADYTNGMVEVFGNDLYYGKKLMKGALAERITHLLRQGMLVDPFVKFMEKVEQNPLESAREELFAYAESNNHPICPDGDFLAYKYVNSDYLDTYSQTIPNHIGTIVRMNREDVNPDRHQTCSSGLHVCAFGYLSGSGNSDKRLIICKVNPKNVVAIPADYKNQKMRVCEYLVVDEMREWADLLEPNYTEQYVEWEEEDEEEWDEWEEESEEELESDWEESWVESTEEDEEQAWIDSNCTNDEEETFITKYAKPKVSFIRDNNYQEAIDVKNLLSLIEDTNKRRPMWNTVQTGKKNDGDRVETRVFKQNKDGVNITSKITEDDVRRIRKLLREDWTLAGIAREFGISARQVARIRDGESWTDV